MAAITHHKLADINFEVLKRPAYSPNLAPSGFHVCCSPTFSILSGWFKATAAAE